ncbi:uncharacterized protein LOC131636161 [Vicia villosa]|uniref:uncharacterized protein LOC131636161 n=1 Tax=Vicia villosa TaxID=3911 RepID=UPI00273C4FCD|nr:uncharacterized protein LOC131636161 [Vicia villosa]
MIIYSLNIRGGGKRVKRRRIGFNIQKGRADIAFIQETKLNAFHHKYAEELWGNDLVEWSHMEAVGASGGILTMWKKDFFSLLYSFRGEGFLGVCVEKDNTRIYFVNIYASCDHNIRMASWKKLVDLKRKSVAGMWCLGGDFNIVSSLEERVGISNKNYKREIEGFNEFIVDMDLVDPPTIGGKFTWSNKSDSALSRLDRFLLSNSFVDVWKVEGQSIGERDVSDHAPIWIKDNKRDWGPKPFRFNNLWFSHEEFFNFVEVEWKKLEVKGRGDYCLVEKLRAIKNKIRIWNKEIFGWIDLNIEEAGKEMHFLDNKFAHFAGNVPEAIVLQRSKAAIDFWNNLYKKEGYLRLKSRQLWLSDGDSNTHFFHNSLKARRRRNALCSLSSNRGVLENVVEIKDYVHDFLSLFLMKTLREGRLLGIWV